MRTALQLIALSLMALITGCGDSREPEVYTVPKEEDAAAGPMMGSGTMPPSAMASRQLPAEALNADDENPDWTQPEGWETGATSSMRRGSFMAAGSAGAVDIAVTSFPGDVGGLLANINRWRGQIGLSPINEAALAESIERQEINGKEAVITRMEGQDQSTLAAIFMHEDNSWFFKMTGPSASVNEQAPAFVEFIQSVQFPDDE